MSDILYIDLETVHATSLDIIKDITDNIQPPKNIKLDASKIKWFKEKGSDAVNDALSKTSFNGFAGEIVCIGWAVNDKPVQTIHRGVGESESDMLEYFWNRLVLEHSVNFNPLYVAHNIEFDLPFLYKRCLVNNIKPLIDLPRNPRAWDKRVFCTLHETMGLNHAGGSLDKLSRLLGLGHKTDGIDGSMVNQAWLDGKIIEIADYCKNDVELLRKLYKRILFL